MALPLKIHNRVIGVLDVQSTEAGAFSDEDIAILQTMADQVAVAIENARLLNESQYALRELQALHRQQLRDAWRERTAAQPASFRYTGVSVERGDLARLRETIPPVIPAQPTVVEGKDGRRLTAPIRLRGETLGAVVFHQAGDEAPWSDEEIALVEELTTQVGLALENARLLEETEQRAEQERIIAQITARVRASMDPETILRTAVRELGAALGTDRAFVRLGVGANGDQRTSHHPAPDEEYSGRETE
jgi:GAF domain-containing protein